MAVPSFIMQQVKKCRNNMYVWPACVCVYIYVKIDKIQKMHETRLWRFREMIENKAVKMKSSL